PKQRSLAKRSSPSKEPRPGLSGDAAESANVPRHRSLRRRLAVDQCSFPTAHPVRERSLRQNSPVASNDSIDERNLSAHRLATYRATPVGSAKTGRSRETSPAIGRWTARLSQPPCRSSNRPMEPPHDGPLTPSVSASWPPVSFPAWARCAGG